MSANRLRTAEERLQRLLVMLPWLMEVGEAPLVPCLRECVRLGGGLGERQAGSRERGAGPT